MLRVQLSAVVVVGTLILASGCDAPKSPPLPVRNAPSSISPPPTSTTAKGQADAQSAVVQNEPLEIDPVSGLVKAPGYVVVAQQCAICHSLKLVTQNRGDKKHWKSLLTWMQRTQGLWQFAPAQEDEILTYLSTHYGQSEPSRRPNLPRHLMPTKPSVDAAKVARAKKAIKGLAGTLQTALKQSLSAGAPAAVQACHAIAPTASGDDPRVRVGRTSRRLRNPKNTAPPWVAPLLESYENGSTAPELVAARPNGGVGVVKPIRLKPLCLRCHGTAIDAAVKAQLSALYPTDKATGYGAGELRGVFWAELD